MNRPFSESGRLKQLELTAIGAVVVAAACVMIGQSAERYAGAESPAVAQLDAAPPAPGSQPRNAPVFNAIDYATTGSIKGQTVVLSPCGAQPASR